MAREEVQGVQATATCFEVGATCLLVAPLGALQYGGNAVQVARAAVDLKRQRTDQGVGGSADLAQRQRRIFPPAAAGSGGLGRDDSPG